MRRTVIARRYKVSGSIEQKHLRVQTTVGRTAESCAVWGPNLDCGVEVTTWAEYDVSMLVRPGRPGWCRDMLMDVSAEA